MTQNEIIEMARQAGFDPHDMSSDFTCNLENINAFAKLIVEDYVGDLEKQMQVLKARIKELEGVRP